MGGWADGREGEMEGGGGGGGRGKKGREDGWVDGQLDGREEWKEEGVGVGRKGFLLYILPLTFLPVALATILGPPCM